jgi:prolyl-tRNA synthetase
MSHIASQKDDFSQWYLDCVEKADLAEYSDVRGCIVFKPYGYAIWEQMQQDMDRRIKALGVKNCYFPLFIPESMLAKEEEHVEGFAPQCAVVTHGGGKELPEKLYVRPTSETIIYSTFAKWVGSYRDLPIKINQWCNIVRWEMRTRPFLRTLEFLWQEGHTVHATCEEADAMAQAALNMYASFDRELLAIPVITGKKPDHDKFAGAFYTLTTEALAKDGKVIQAGTSHNLGQGFSEAFGVRFLDEDGKEKKPWMTSWGVSTRLIGTVIVVHGDEWGLRLPPRLAPIQTVLVPIYKESKERERVLNACHELLDTWEDDPSFELRAHLDDREGKTPGFKFANWELRGVPLRIEIGPKDLEKGAVTMVRRDTGARSQMKWEDAKEGKMMSVLEEIQEGLLAQAEKFVEDHTHEVGDYKEFKDIMSGEGGVVWAPWDGTVESAEKIQQETKATIRVLPDRRPSVKGKKDMVSRKPAKEMALWAKAY